MKKSILTIWAVLLAIFVMCAFLIPSHRTRTFWVAFIFTVLAYAIGFYMLRLLLKQNRTPVSRFYGLPVFYVCFGYICIQTITFFVFKFLPNIPFWIVILISVLIASISIVGFISLEASKNYVETIDQKANSKVKYIKTLLLETELVLSHIKDENVRMKVEALIEKIRYSDPMSAPELEDVENELRNKIELIKTADGKELIALCEEVTGLLDKRNKQCKLLKM